VHAGLTLEETQNSLQRIAVRVRSAVVPSGRLPVGLWLPEPVARQLAKPSHIARFGDWLAERGLKPYTLNGFPQGDFHQAVVKHAVYEPSWLDSARVEYTCLLADNLAGLLGKGEPGSISTVPLGWPSRRWGAAEFTRAAKNLQQVALHLNALAERTGHEIVVAIEPEPGCVLDTCEDVINFFDGPLFSDAGDVVRRHITVCHDICHSAVMFESQEHALQSYARHGIRIGKLQVSSAVEVPWHEVEGDADQGRAMTAQIRSFDEPRYLHQTTRQRTDGAAVELVEDLPLALQQWLPSNATATALPSTEDAVAWK
jgi:sugar phosphate isomerase/epimerase